MTDDFAVEKVDNAMVRKRHELPWDAPHQLDQPRELVEKMDELRESNGDIFPIGPHQSQRIPRSHADKPVWGEIRLIEDFVAPREAEDGDDITSQGGVGMVHVDRLPRVLVFFQFVAQLCNVFLDDRLQT